jgi:hypothetical protein
MQKRVQRDVLPVLDPNVDRNYTEQIRSKKRKFAEAFPKNAVESSLEDSFESGSSRKKRLLNDVREQSEYVIEYQESINYLR